MYIYILINVTARYSMAWHHGTARYVTEQSNRKVAKRFLCRGTQHFTDVQVNCIVATIWSKDECYHEEYMYLYNTDSSKRAKGPRPSTMLLDILQEAPNRSRYSKKLTQAEPAHVHDTIQITAEVSQNQALP